MVPPASYPSQFHVVHKAQVVPPSQLPQPQAQTASDGHIPPHGNPAYIATLCMSVEKLTTELDKVRHDVISMRSAQEMMLEQENQLRQRCAYLEAHNFQLTETTHMLGHEVAQLRKMLHSMHTNQAAPVAPMHAPASTVYSTSVETSAPESAPMGVVKSPLDADAAPYTAPSRAETISSSTAAAQDTSAPAPLSDEGNANSRYPEEKPQSPPEPSTPEPLAAEDPASAETDRAAANEPANGAAHASNVEAEEVPESPLPVGMLLSGGVIQKDMKFLERAECYCPALDACLPLAEMPKACAYGAMVPYQESVFAIGGGDPKVTAGGYMYSVRDDSWHPIRAMPIQRGSHGLEVAGGQIYALGGGNLKELHYNTVDIYDINTDAWSTGPEMECSGAMPWWPVDGEGRDALVAGRWCRARCLGGRWMVKDAMRWWPDVMPRWPVDVARRDALDAMPWWPVDGAGRDALRFAVGTAMAHGSIYALGGVTGGSGAKAKYQNSVERLDPRVGRWESVAEMAEKRGGHAVSVVRDELVALGGFNGLKSINDVEVYDSRADKWRQASKLQRNRSAYVSAGVMDGKLYVVGGVNPAKSRAGAACEGMMEVYDASKDTWEQLKMPESLEQAMDGRVFNA
eukprot:gene1434-2054_t